MGGPPDAEELLGRAEDSLAALATAVAVLSDALHRPRTAPAPAPALVPRQRSGGGVAGEPVGHAPETGVPYSLWGFRPGGSAGA